MPRNAGPGGTTLLAVTLTNSPARVRETLEQVTAALRTLDLTPEERFSVELLIAETLNNIVEHAYARPESGRIALTLTPAPDGLHCEVTDDGNGLPDGALPAGLAPDTDVGRSDLPEGGFGWFLIRKLAHDVCYDSAGGLNRLRFRIVAGPAVLPDARNALAL